MSFPLLSNLSPARRGLVSLLLLLPLLGLAARPAAAVNRSWAFATNGAADDPTKWSPAGIPDATSMLTFDKLGTYSIAWSGTVPQTDTWLFSAGTQTINLTGTHTLGALHNSNSAITINGGSIVGPIAANGTYLQFGTSTSNGSITLTGGAHLSAAGYVGYNNGVAQLNIFGGSQFNVAAVNLSILAAGTVNIAGFSTLPIVYSGLHTVDDPAFPLSVGGNITAYNGGYIDAGSDVFINGGASATSLQTINLGPVALSGTSYLNAHHSLIVGKKYNPPSFPLVGMAELNVNSRGFANANGLCTVGDSISDNGCAIRVQQGGTVILNGGLRVYTTAGEGLDLRGGIVHLNGGPFRWPASKLLKITSQIGTPELWITNGTPSNVGPNSGSPSTSALMVGRAGTGTLRVTQPNTVLALTGATTVGDSLGGVGSIVVDSSATLTMNGLLVVGNRGNGALFVRNGSHASATVTSIGVAATGNGDLEVIGAGSTFTAKDNIWVGGGFSGDGSTGSLIVDSSATVTVLPTGINPALVTVWPTAGLLAVANGGTLNTGSVDVRGSVVMSGGTINAQFYGVQTAGRINGWGTLAGNINSNGSISPSSFFDSFGAFRVTGNFSQFSVGHYRVQLGNGRRCDTLAVSGTATLGGTLDITLAPGFYRTPGDTFTILTCATRSGLFSAITWNGSPISDQIQVLYQPNAVRLVIPPSALGVDPIGIPDELRFSSLGARHGLAFELDLPAAADVEVALYDVTGRKLASLAAGSYPAGRHTLTSATAGDPLWSGVYFARAIVRTQGHVTERVARGILVR